MNIQFGMVSKVKSLDKEGSTKQVDDTILNGESKSPLRVSYKMRVRVHNQTEEHQEYVKFSDEVNDNRSMLDPCFMIEHNRLGDQSGYYYVVRCYTILEY